jgi:uncharacterized membrane protein YcaP (DUF421 family)
MDFSSYYQIALELGVGFIVLLISVKILGNREMQQITPFDFVSAIVLGELVGNTVYDKESNISHMIFATVLWTILLLIILYITQKSLSVRKLIQGHAELLIKEGKIQYDVLKKVKLDISELISQLRERDVFSVQEVDYAFLEISGSITVKKKERYANPTNQDLNVTPKPSPLNLPLIQDGDVLNRNLEIFKKDDSWLKSELKKEKIQSIKDVIYAEWNSADGWHIQVRENSKK